MINTEMESSHQDKSIDIPETEPLALGPLLSDSPGKCPGENFGPKSLKTLFSKFKIQNWEANSTQR